MTDSRDSAIWVVCNACEICVGDWVVFTSDPDRMFQIARIVFDEKGAMFWFAAPYEQYALNFRKTHMVPAVAIQDEDDFDFFVRKHSCIFGQKEFVDAVIPLIKESMKRAMEPGDPLYLMDLVN